MYSRYSREKSKRTTSIHVENLPASLNRHFPVFLRFLPIPLFRNGLGCLHYYCRYYFGRSMADRLLTFWPRAH